MKMVNYWNGNCISIKTVTEDEYSGVLSICDSDFVPGHSLWTFTHLVLIKSFTETDFKWAM